MRLSGRGAWQQRALNVTVRRRDGQVSVRYPPTSPAKTASGSGYRNRATMSPMPG